VFAFVLAPSMRYSGSEGYAVAPVPSPDNELDSSILSPPH